MSTIGDPPIIYAGEESIPPVVFFNIHASIPT